MEHNLLEAMVRYAHEAGVIAKSEQANLHAQVKADDSYVTEVDLRLSKMAFTFFSGLVPDHHIITEEHLENLHALPDEPAPGEPELLLIIDPIDGTRNYFHNMPLYGVSVAVLRNREPWLGVVTFPSLGETFVADSAGAYLITDAYGDTPVNTRLEPADQELNSNSVILLANSVNRRYTWNYDVCTMMLTACVAMNSCWPAIRRGIGTVYSDHIWDFAGSWPVLVHLGFELKGTDSGRAMTRYVRSDYDQSHRLKEPILVCRPEHYERLRTGLMKR